MKCTSQNKNYMLIWGIVGISITIPLNLIGHYILHQPAAQIFSNGWWSTWFTSHMIWVSLGLAGLGQMFSERTLVEHLAYNKRIQLIG